MNSEKEEAAHWWFERVLAGRIGLAMFLALVLVVVLALLALIWFAPGA